MHGTCHMIELSGFSIENHPPARICALQAFAVNLVSTLASATSQRRRSSPSGFSTVLSTLKFAHLSFLRAELYVRHGGAQ